MSALFHNRFVKMAIAFLHMAVQELGEFVRFRFRQSADHNVFRADRSEGVGVILNIDSANLQGLNGADRDPAVLVHKLLGCHFAILAGVPQKRYGRFVLAHAGGKAWRVAA